MLSFRAIRTFLGTFAGSMISFFCGLPLGSEGPAVLIGTALGRIVCMPFGKRVPYERYVMTGGAGAAFAIATGAPLSGILFALEEIHKRFTPMLILTVSFSTLSAAFVNALLCHLTHISPHLFEIPRLASFQLSDTGYLLLFGLGIALSVALFDGSIYLFNRLTDLRKNLLPRPVKLIIFFLLSGLLGLFFAEGIYSGHEVIDSLLLHKEHIAMILLILAVRLCMMLLATDCGATGGLFIPTLAVAALLSALFTRLLILIGMSEELYAVTMLLGMCAFLGGTLRSPLVSAVFFLELTGQFTDLFYVALVVFLVTFLTELVNLTSFYDRVMDNMEKRQNEGKTAKISRLELTVSPNAFVIGKAVRDVMWPASSIILGITRANESDEDMDHDGEKMLLAGDRVLLRARYYDEKKLLEQLASLSGNIESIRIIEE
jgi:H+/Cl- antiporter ClcA